MPIGASKLCAPLKPVKMAYRRSGAAYKKTLAAVLTLTAANVHARWHLLFTTGQLTPTIGSPCQDSAGAFLPGCTIHPC
eukprot:1162092-Pelagomonas_calceolata.AAC.13